jgi:uncharacterized protein YecE (DUF72 family)
MRVRVGTSGYNYPEWKGHFYPADLPAKAMFDFYAARFRTVEINYTFYRMPTTKNAESWRAQAPDGFSYTLKAPRRITHDRKLKDADDLVRAFCDAAQGLGEARACLLFQLPPTFRCDVARLRDVLAAIPAGLRPAFEFRHDSWLTDEVYAALEAGGAALCVADFGDKTTPLRPTSRHGYFRLRDEGYTLDDIARWSDEVAARAGDWDEVYVYFKHEDEGKGPAFARLFVDALRDRHGMDADA